MTYVLLSQRLKNAKEKCATCFFDNDGKCKMPVIIGRDDTCEGRIYTAKLILTSKDGKTCQLYRPKVI